SQELLGVLESALRKLGSEPRLESLIVIVRENVEREAIEKKKAECLQNAKELLRRKAYPEAIHVLEAGCAELTDSGEIEDLLQFARDEEAAEKCRLAIAECKERTQVLIEKHDHRAAIKQLEEALTQYPDEELQLLLIEARQAAVNHEQKLDLT